MKHFVRTHRLPLLTALLSLVLVVSEARSQTSRPLTIPPEQPEQLWTLASSGGVLEVKVLLDAAEQRPRIAFGKPGAAPDGVASVGIVSVRDDGSEDLGVGCTVVKRTVTDVRDEYELISGKRKSCLSSGKRMTLELKAKNGQLWTLLVHVQDDGCGFRWSIPGTGALTLKENISVATAPDLKAWLAGAGHNNESQWGSEILKAEKPQLEKDGTPKKPYPDSRYQVPILFELAGGRYCSLSESGLLDQWCGSAWAKPRNETGRVYISPDPKDPQLEVKLPITAPWRTATVGSLRTIVESTLVTDLADPRKPGDWSWVKPGRVAWSWPMEGTGTTEMQKEFIDIAQKLSWEYVLFDEGWQGYKPQGTAIPELVAYAKERNVRVLTWFTNGVDRKSIERNQQMGVAGLKADFFNSDRREAYQRREAICRDAADFQQLVNFHGDTPPRGQERTWPHLMTREGIRGAENHRGQSHWVPAHRCIVPFTRNAVGPMDYTPLNLNPRYKMPSTRAQEFAVLVLFQSGLQHMAESREVLKALSPAEAAFVKACPANWDDIHFIDGDVGQWCAIARRLGDDWFVGVISAKGAAHSVSLPLSFLKKGASYRMEILHDAEQGKDTVAETSNATTSTVLEVKMQPYGGCAARLTPIR